MIIMSYRRPKRIAAAPRPCRLLAPRMLCRLRIGDRHEAHADGRVLIRPDNDLALTPGQNLPPERLRPEPGQPRQVVSVHNDVMEPDRHAVSIRGHAGLHPREPACYCRAPRP